MSNSAQEIEREVEASRTNVEETIDALKDRLSVGQLVDEGMRYMRGSAGGDVVARLGDQIRENPLPLALVGVGLAWLMSGRGQPHLPGSSGNGSRAQNPLTQPRMSNSQHSSSRPYDPASSLRSTSDPQSDDEGITGTIRDGASSAAEWVSEKAGAVSEAGRDAVDRMSHTSSRAYDSAADYAEGAYSGVRRGFGEVLEREPLILGAIGLAVGAAIGAILPRTEIEDRYLGETSAHLIDDAKELAEEQLEKGKDVAAKAYEAVRDELVGNG